MIEKEVRKQQLSITKFAEKINCKRGNVYDIFQRNCIDIDLLRRISIVLGHNFFEDLAKDKNLARPTDFNEEELKKLRAINQFLECVPKAFERLGINVAIVLGNKTGIEKEIPLPDYVLSVLNITFTVEESYYKRSANFWNGAMIFQSVDGICQDKMVEYYRFDDKIQYLDIAIDYKTEDEWFETINLAVDAIKKLYSQKTWEYLKRISNDIH